MGDLYVAIALMLLLSLGLFALVVRSARRLSRGAASGLLVLCVGLLVLFTWILADGLWLARLIPLTSVVILGDWTPLLVAAAAGLAWGRMPGAARRRAVLLVPLAGLCLWRSYARLGQDLPPLNDDRWRRGVCLQTSDASCSAAAAATLLRERGIDATEAEMARLCLTRGAGTPMLGLYRGLKLKTAGTAYEVEPFHTDLTGLRSLAADGPVILSVGLPRDTAGLDSRYERLWGWTPGVRHTVVLFGFAENSEVEIGDPAAGREHWSAADLPVLWGGDGLRLVRRSSGRGPAPAVTSTLRREQPSDRRAPPTGGGRRR